MKSSFVTHDDYDINRMDCLKPYQPYGLLQAIQHPLKHWYAHKHKWLGLQVQGLYNVASTSRTLTLPRFHLSNSLRKAKSTHRGGDFQK